MGGVSLPPWKLFGLRDPALSMGSMVELMVTSKRAFIKEHLPRLLLPVSQSLWWAQLMHTLTGNPSLWFCLLWGHCSFPLGLGVHKIFICALQDWSLCFPQSCGSPISNPPGPQGQVPWEFPVPLLDPQAGKSDVGFRIFTTVRELLWYYCSPVCRSPTSRYGIWFYYDCTPPIIFLCDFFFVFIYGVSFLWWVPASSYWWSFNS